MATAMTTNKRSTKKPQPAKRSLRSSSVKKSPKPKTTKKVITLPLLGRKKITLTIQVADAKPKKKTARKTTKAKNTKSGQLRRNAVTIALLVVGLAGFIYSSTRVFAAPKLEPVAQTVVVEAPAAKPVAVKKSLKASNAVRLEIAAIGVNAPVEIVQKQNDGSLEVPSDAKTVGQYAEAPTPGEIGPAIITGHVDTFRGPAVFWRLRELTPGKIVTIKRADGGVAKFKVTSVKSFDQDNFPTKQVYGNIDHAGLRLITCGGSFNYLTRHYTENTVVFASLISD